MDGPCALGAVPRLGPRLPRAGLLRRQPCDRCGSHARGLLPDGRRHRSGACRSGGAAVDHPSCGLGCRRVDRPGCAGDRHAAPVRDRPSHRRLEQLFGRRVGRDRPRDPALSRGRKRLGRHRLQLPRRQVRPRVRRPGRRDHPERGRSPCGWLQHRQRGGRGHRDLRVHVPLRRGEKSAPEAPRLASRRGPRLSPRPLGRGVRRELPLSRRRVRPAPSGLGSSRHEPHELSGQQDLRPPQVDRAAGDAHRPAEALEPGGRRWCRRARPLHRPALRSAPLDRGSEGCRRHRGRLGLGQWDSRRLGLGRAAPCRSPPTPTPSAPARA